MILSSLPYSLPPKESAGLIAAPRTTYSRSKVLWTEEGKQAYKLLIESELRNLREVWLSSSSLATTSVLLQSTNTLLSLAATTTNPSILLGEKRLEKKIKPPKTMMWNLNKEDSWQNYSQLTPNNCILNNNPQLIVNLIEKELTSIKF